MQTMYPSKVGSPTTIITGNLATSTTAIPVQDIEAFTDAPGLATLFDEDGKQEVVLYTGISFETLTGVTRAFEGTASTWPTGTFIARLLTAHDINTLQANVTTLDGEKTDGTTFTNHVQSIASDTVLGHVKVGTNLTITGDGTLNAEAGGASSADEVTYVNTTSGLTATDVQAAIDEVDGDLDTHKAETATIVRIKQNVTVLQTGWVDDTATSGYWLYDVTDTDITADMAVDAYIHLTSLDDATMVLPVNQSATGKFTLYANTEPLVNIIIDYSILNQIGGV